MAQTHKYAYSSLNPLKAEIRLLKLQPGSRQDGLSAALNVASLESSPAPRYETISYVWGDSEKVAFISIDSATLRVPANTAAALRRARSALEDRVLWIDAVCIDQENPTERSQQVAMMSDIYRRSAGNIVHLLDDENMAPLLVSAFRNCASEARRETKDWSELRSYLLKPRRSVHARPLSDRDIKTMHQFLKAPWFRGTLQAQEGTFEALFSTISMYLDEMNAALGGLHPLTLRRSRLWVLQEARFSPSNVCLIANESIDLLELLRVLKWFYSVLQHLTNTDAWTASSLAALNCMHQLHSFVDVEQSPLMMMPFYLTHLLSLTKVFEKSEPRDGVFALLGMVDSVVSPRSKLPVADYTMPLPLVLQEATLSSIAEQGLIITNDVSHREGDLDSREFASWVFRADRTFDRMYDPATLPVRPPLYSGKQLPSRPWTRLGSSNNIACEGYSFDAVNAITSTCSVETFYGALHSWMRESLELLTSPETAENAQHFPELAYSICAGKSEWHRDASPEDVAKLVRYLETISLEDIDEEALDVLGEAFDAAENVCTMAYLLNRRLFRTTTGRYGLGPAFMASGDAVVVLRDGMHPAILRPCGDQYLFVGTAYIHKIMVDDSLKRRLEDGEAEEEIFILC